jgi:hypothetical protein
VIEELEQEMEQNVVMRHNPLTPTSRDNCRRRDETRMFIAQLLKKQTTVDTIVAPSDDYESDLGASQLTEVFQQER